MSYSISLQMINKNAIIFYQKNMSKQSSLIWHYLLLFMQTRVKDYARVLNVWFFLNLLPPNVFPSFWPVFSIFCHIKARSDMFRHNHIYSGIIQAYSGISEPCVILAYSVLSYIQNLRHIQNPGILRFLNYPEERHIRSHFGKWERRG